MRAPSPAARDWSRSAERSNAFALWLIARVAVFCGRRVARLCLYPITLYFLLLAPEPRRHSRRYLSRALGRPATWRDVARHFHHFSATVLDRVYFLRNDTAGFALSVSGDNVLRGTMAAGQGAFLIGAHLGSFEALGAAGRQRGDLPIAMVMFPDNARRLHAALQAIAPGSGLKVIALGQRGSTLAIRDHLDSGGLVGLLADRRLPGSAQRAKLVSVPFLGQQALFSDGPFRLAQVLRRPVLFMVGLYNGGQAYDARLDLLADFSLPPADAAQRERQVLAATTAYAARLEALCRESPYNWFNFHDFWHEDVAQDGGRGRPGESGLGAGPGAGTGRADGRDGPAAGG
jgi:predicted LPLAT superfamily acyltransferase